MYMAKSIIDHMRKGYACMNITLKKEWPRRRLFKKQFEEGGLELVSEVTLHNLVTLSQIMLWNKQNQIDLYRYTDIMPWYDKYQFEDLPQWDNLQREMRMIGELADLLDQRLTVHPSSFCVLASPTDAYVDVSVTELNQAGRLFDEMGLQRTHFNKINIHVGGTYKNKELTLDRLCKNFRRLNPSTRDRLTIENDDKATGYSLLDLYEGVHKRIGIPLVFDYFHHKFNDGGLTEQEALDLAVSTWPPDINPVVHFSNSRREYEDEGASPTAHSDWIYERVDTYGHDVDIMFECKKTELAVLKYQEDVLP